MDLKCIRRPPLAPQFELLEKRRQTPSTTFPQLGFRTGGPGVSTNLGLDGSEVPGFAGAMRSWGCSKRAVEVPFDDLAKSALGRTHHPPDGRL